MSWVWVIIHLLDRLIRQDDGAGLVTAQEGLAEPQLRQQEPGGQPVVEEAAVPTHQLCVLIRRPAHQLLRRM